MNVPWLTVVLALPLGASLLLQAVPRSATGAIKALTVGATLVTAVIVAVLVAAMNGTRLSPGPLGFHYEEQHSWIPAIGASYHLGLDGISAWILALNAAVFLLGAVLISRRDTDRLKLFCGLLLLTETMTAGVLLSLDLLLFYLFWEGMLIPLYFILANYGNENRGRATVKFMIYTVAGSLLMLVSIIALQFAGGHQSFDITALLGGNVQLSSGSLAPALPHIKAGTLRCLAVTGDQRWPELPDVPTMVQAGYKDFVFAVDCALLAPAKTPPEAVKWLEAETLKVLQTKDIQDKLHKAGFLVRAQGADACWKRVNKEIVQFRDIIETAHIKKM